jgi:ABC-type branched-subunit amino acid transport system permease subunit
VALRSNRLGRLLGGLAQSPIALDAHGANTNITRMLVFCVSAFLAGLAGALMGPITGAATGATFDVSISLLLLAVLFIAGRRPVLGPLLAAGLYVVLPGYLTNRTALDNVPVAFGVAAVVAATPAVGFVLSRMRMSKRANDRRRAANPAHSRTVAAQPA